MGVLRRIKDEVHRALDNQRWVPSAEFPPINVWNSASDGLSLGNTRDFVSIEIESALERHVPIIPVLVQGATIPSEEELPDKLRSFAYYNAIPIRPDPDLNQDCPRLIQGIEFHICAKAKKVNYERRPQLWVR